MRFGSLFSGIGGLDLGLERAGMECAWQVEIDDYCQRVLQKHWPEVRRYKDVKEVHGIMAHAAGIRRRELTPSPLKKRQADERSEHKGIISRRLEGRSELASTGACPSCLEPVDLIAGGFPCQPHSVAGKRRGKADDRNLWPEYLRIIGEIRPRYVLGENVPGIVTTYLDTVLSDLEGAGYTCVTLNIPAVAFDAPHRRERIFVVAYANGEYVQEYKRRYQLEEATGEGTLGWGYESQRGQWSIEPPVGRVADGVPARVDRLRGLGNAVVPQVAEWLGRRILEHLCIPYRGKERRR